MIDSHKGDDERDLIGDTKEADPVLREVVDTLDPDVRRDDTGELSWHPTTSTGQAVGRQ